MGFRTSDDVCFGSAADAAGFALALLRSVAVTLQPRFQLGVERIIAREHVIEVGPPGKVYAASPRVHVR